MLPYERRECSSHIHAARLLSLTSPLLTARKIRHDA